MKKDDRSWASGGCSDGLDLVVRPHGEAGDTRDDGIELAAMLDMMVLDILGLEGDEQEMEV